MNFVRIDRRPDRFSNRYHSCQRPSCVQRLLEDVVAHSKPLAFEDVAVVAADAAAGAAGEYSRVANDDVGIAAAAAVGANTAGHDAAARSAYSADGRWHSIRRAATDVGYDARNADPCGRFAAANVDAAVAAAVDGPL